MREPALDLFDVGELSEPVAETVRRIAVVDEAAEHLRARGRIELSGDGHLLAVHGLSRRSTAHRIRHDGGEVNTWCALDAIGIPAALAIDAKALTQCPACARALTVTLTGGIPAPLAGVVLWYPETDGCGGHLLDDFCSGANLFCSTDHLQRWLGDRPAAGRDMTLDQVADVGREAWSDVAPPPCAGGMQADRKAHPSPRRTDDSGA